MNRPSGDRWREVPFYNRKGILQQMNYFTFQAAKIVVVCKGYTLRADIFFAPVASLMRKMFRMKFARLRHEKSSPT
ncbi:hypothetical protein IID62_10305 [candidate division KSB1 bacterium]|nr:hypothetical protein [candidate division KSB1 bacterium]